MRQLFMIYSQHVLKTTNSINAKFVWFWSTTGPKHAKLR